MRPKLARFVKVFTQRLMLISRSGERLCGEGLLLLELGKDLKTFEDFDRLKDALKKVRVAFCDRPGAGKIFDFHHDDSSAGGA